MIPFPLFQVFAATDAATANSGGSNADSDLSDFPGEHPSDKDLTMYIRGLLLEMGVDITAPTTVYVDNSGAVELSKDLKLCNRSRHIERRYLWVRELVHHLRYLNL